MGVVSLLDTRIGAISATLRILYLDFDTIVAVAAVTGQSFGAVPSFAGHQLTIDSGSSAAHYHLRTINFLEIGYTNVSVERASTLLWPKKPALYPQRCPRHITLCKIIADNSIREEAVMISERSAIMEMRLDR